MSRRSSIDPTSYTYEAPEYLPPLDTGGSNKRSPTKADPEYAAQSIISVPPEADNRKQTIVTPPKLKLKSEVPIVNVVAWSHVQPVIPLAATTRASDLNVPALPTDVVAPTPEVSRTKSEPAPAISDSVVAPTPELNAVISKNSVRTPQAAVVEPPPSVETASTRKLSDINIGHAQVVEPAPQLPVAEQHALSSRARESVGHSSTAVVPPAPLIQASGIPGQDGRLIALSVHPALPTGPVEVPNGNRRGTFAATPQGKPGATATPEIPPGNNHGGTASQNSAGAKSETNGLPPGLLVGAKPKTQTNTVASEGLKSQRTDDPSLIARASPPRPSSSPRSVAAEMSSAAQTESERKVFAGRKSYAMNLSVPNLNSAGGSWVIHFAELGQGDIKGELLAPVATRAVDPGYPLELMRQNVQGTVTLSAVIQSDGHVGDVTVLNGVDDRLDQYARAALSSWQFLPAMRDGSPVSLQAVVMIPFRPARRSGF